MGARPAPPALPNGRPSRSGGQAQVSQAKPRPSPEAAAARFRVALEYALRGELRFLSHRDELRMLMRALVRARWPVAYSQGFNPLPRLSVPFPRNLGTAAERQLALADLREARAPAELLASLAGALPADCLLQRVTAPAPRVTPHPLRVTYEVELRPEEAAGIGERLAALTAREALTIERESGPGKPTRAVDIRPYIDRLEVEGGWLRLHLRFAQQRTARPSEILTELGLAASCGHRLRRGAVQWDIELPGPCVGPALHERKPLDQEEEFAEDRART